MKRNNLKDFIVNGIVLGVTHLFVLTRGDNWITLRIIRSPQGPTLTFRGKTDHSKVSILPSNTFLSVD